MLKTTRMKIILFVFDDSHHINFPCFWCLVMTLLHQYVLYSCFHVDVSSFNCFCNADASWRNAFACSRKSKASVVLTALISMLDFPSERGWWCEGARRRINRSGPNDTTLTALRNKQPIVSFIFDQSCGAATIRSRSHRDFISCIGRVEECVGCLGFFALSHVVVVVVMALGAPGGGDRFLLLDTYRSTASLKDKSNDCSNLTFLYFSRPGVEQWLPLT